MKTDKTTESKTDESKTDTSQKIFLGGLLVVVPFAVQFLYQLHQIVNQRISENPTVNLPCYEHFSVAVQWTFIFVVLRYVFGNYVFNGLAERMVSKTKYDKEERVMRVLNVGHMLFKLSYFVVFSGYTYYVLKEKDFLPPELGGTGAVKNAWNGFPNTEVDETLSYLFFIGMAYHVMSLIYHLALERKADFMEMFLHHTITIFLIFFSYLGGYLKFGVLVYITHDSTDIFSYLVKIIITTQNPKLSIIGFVLLLTTWGYGRIYAFPRYIIYEAIFGNPPEGEFHGYYFFNIMLIMLYCLHIYWYSLFIRIGYRYATKGVIRDNQVEGFKKDKKIKQ